LRASQASVAAIRDVVGARRPRYSRAEEAGVKKAGSPRSLTDVEARGLAPGSEHYTAFVGPPDQYDLMGATQFALLVALGLRDSHRVLDFGCGSLRVGRLLIPYLQRGNYHGLEPNSWLVEDAIARQIGRDQIAIKSPRFHAFHDFRADRCGADFDFVLAQSILSHTGADLVEAALIGFRRALAASGLALVTFVRSAQTGVRCTAAKGWVYPDCVAYAPAQIAAFIDRSGLVGRALSWFHPRQTWYALARDPVRLPPAGSDCHLRGAIFNVPEWQDSLLPARTEDARGG
jgi:SAM-dependent methyltransferase